MTNTEAVEKARIKRTPPPVSKEKGQRSLQFNEPFLFRFFPQWSQPDWLGAKKWRSFVQAQPFAVDCREAILNYMLSLDWKIVPRDTDKWDELKPLITYYTNFLTYTGEYHFSDIIEWIGKDYLDIPFGGGAELGRRGDKPTGRVAWIKLLDGGTLFPTQNTQYPVGQVVPSAVEKPVYFPAYAINRLMMSPRTEMDRFGWGMAPPEKIYLAMEMLSRGDKYYANLLLDTPEAGILDLIDMSKEGAESWIKAMREYMAGVDPFKVGVLYEHTTPAKWIPFGRPPTELMFDRVTLRYAALSCAGYGLTLSDIGFASSTSGGDTLAGSIRQERRSKKSGISKAKKRFAEWFNRLIDPTQKVIKFEWIDLDDELAVAKSRARLANATAMKQMIDSGIITPEEGRMQTIADGTFTISMPEKLPPSAKPKTEEPTSERPGLLGKPVTPSQGGHGEVLAKSSFAEQFDILLSVPDIEIKRLINAVAEIIDLGVSKAKQYLNDDEIGFWSQWQHSVIWGDTTDDIPEFTSTLLDNARAKLNTAMVNPWWETFSTSDTLITEIVEVLSDVQFESDYVNGIYNGSPYEYKAELSLLREWETFLSETFAEFDDLLKHYVQNSVISGITQYLSVNILDERLKIDDNLINIIRSQLMLCTDKIAERFETKLTNYMEKK